MILMISLLHGRQLCVELFYDKQYTKGRNNWCIFYFIWFSCTDEKLRLLRRPFKYQLKSYKIAFQLHKRD
jgi:hypothetical protein